MNFSKLSDSDIEYIGEIHSNPDISWDAKMRVLVDKYGRTERTIRRWIKALGFAKKQPIEEIERQSEQLEKAKEKKHDEKEYYLITWAQNDTTVHGSMIKNMEAYAEFLDAEILVIAGRYRNPTSLKASKAAEVKEKVEMTWDSSILSYLTANRHNIHKYVQILADVKVQPTAYAPLSGFEGFSGVESSILGHPKQHLEPLPVLEDYPHKVLFSTGAVTHPNYTDTKAGKKGEFNHIYGFIVVEIKDDEVFFIRNVNVDDSGEFNDLYFNVKDGHVTAAKDAQGIVLGDLHCGFEDEEVLYKTLNLIDEINPGAIVLHDVFDGHSISHHHEKDPFKKYEKTKYEMDRVDVEIECMFSVLEEFDRKEADKYIVRSNHDEHIERYLRERDWKKDIVNSVEYMELALAILKGEASKGIIPYKIEQRFDDFTCLDRNESLNIGGIECALHGDKGSNGSRGSIRQFAKMNVKTITGHSHTPRIFDGAYSVGTSTHLRLDYNEGPSSWMNSHVITDALGKRQQILFVDGEFTTMTPGIL